MYLVHSINGARLFFLNGEISRNLATYSSVHSDAEDYVPGYFSPNGEISSNLATYSSVHSDGEDFAGVAVVADLGGLLEVAHLELARRRLRHDGHEAAREQPLHDVHVLRGCRMRTQI
jgi:hypothetical protein